MSFLAKLYLLESDTNKLFALAQDDKMYNFLFTQKNQEIFTILFKQTSPQAYILNIEVFHDILTFA